MGKLSNAWNAVENFVDRVSDRRRASVAVAEPPAVVEKGVTLSSSDLWWMDLDNLDKGSASSTSAMVRAYIGWTYVCCSLNAQSCAAVPLRMYVARSGRGTKLNVPTRAVDKGVARELLRRQHLQSWGRKAESDDIEEITEHPFLDVLDTANPEENGFDLKYRAFMFLGLVGDGYWYLLQDGLGRVTEVWTRMPQHMTKYASKGFLQRTTRYVYQRRGDNVKYPLRPEEVVHFQQPSPLSLMKGYGNLAASALAADIDKGMMEYEKALLGNQARPDYAFIIKGEMTKGGRDRFKADMKNTYGGHKKAGKPVIIEATDADIKPLGFSPKEMAFLQGHKIIRDRVCAAYHVPISMVATDSVNRSNADTGKQTYAEQALVPLLTLVAGKINERIMPAYGDQVFVAFDSPAGEDQENRRLWRQLNLDKGVTVINEERASDGLEPVEWGDLPLLPMGVAPLGENKPEPPVVPGQEPPEPEDEEPEKAVKASRHARYEEDMNARERGAIKLRPTIRDHFAYLEREVLQRFGKGAKDASDVWTIGLSTWNKRFADKIAPLYKALVFAGGERAMDRLPVVGVSFDVESATLTRHLETYVPKLAGNVHGSVIADLKAALQAGMTAGEGPRELRKRIEVLFTSRTKAGAMRIARTESARAQMQGSLEAWKQSGVVTGKIWECGGDPCDQCAPLCGERMSLDGAFAENSYEVVEAPPLHPNCRCSLLEEIA